jgi:hypothetical protein
MAKRKASRSTALAIRHALARGRSQARPLVLKVPSPIRHKTHHHHSGRSSLGGVFSQKRTALMVGAFAVGVLEKQGIMSQLPALPFIGRTGTIGLAAHMLAHGPGLADDIATAAFVIAAHELGSTGTIVGGEGDDWGHVGYVAG